MSAPSASRPMTTSKEFKMKYINGDWALLHEINESKPKDQWRDSMRASPTPQPAKSSQESSLPSSSGNNSANNIVFLVTRLLSKRTDPNRNQYVIHQGSISWLWRDGSQHVDWTPRTTAYYNQHIHDNKIPTTIKMNEFLLRKKIL